MRIVMVKDELFSMGDSLSVMHTHLTLWRFHTLPQHLIQNLPWGIEADRMCEWKWTVNLLASMCELALPGGQTAWHPSTHVTGQLRGSGCWQVGGQALPQALYFHSHSTPASLFNSSQLSAASQQSVTTHCYTVWLKS